MTREAMNLRVNGACKTYGDFSLKQVSLEVPAGTILGLIGQNGAGKTTLMKAILGSIALEGGSVELFGRNPAELPEKELVALKARVGYVSAVTAFPQLVTAREVSRFYELSYPGFDRARFDEMCGKLSFDALDKPIKELSRGMGMKVQLACVLASGADLLILDEPTAGLDPAGRRSILNMIRNLHAAGGLTVIMVSHSMDDISTLATRLVVMSRGEMVLTGTPREVFLQQELLQSIGLGVPQAAQLAHALRAEGYDLPEDLYTLEEVHEAILRLYGKEDGVC